jgi:hypothetical protein
VPEPTPLPRAPNNNNNINKKRNEKKKKKGSSDLKSVMVFGGKVM